MKITLPRIVLHVGSSAPSEFSANAGSLTSVGRRVGYAFFVSVGKPYAAGFITSRTYERDFQIARRLKALGGIFAFAAMIAAFFIAVAPLTAVYYFGRAADALGDRAARACYAIGDAFDDVANRILIVRRSGLRQQFAALFQAVTK